MVFGDYVSIYNFAASEDDHATVPPYYENRIPHLQIENPTFGDDVMAIAEKADLDETHERQLASVLGQQYKLGVKVIRVRRHLGAGPAAQA
jgi:type I restriction enzyme, R subunit